MAKFNLKDTLILPVKYQNTKLYLTANVVPDNTVISIAGHSVINCLQIEIADVTFSDHPLDYANKLYGATLSVEVNVSKIKTGESDDDGSKIPVSCSLIVDAGNDLLQEYQLDDKKTPTANSRFFFTIALKAEQA
ncbi:hypothetical protein [Taibaiella koreensis]|uniref:hypothetical protein n=1 Tax=Taibaiella koreensis TaxID=1268548 RepID=UPI0013C2CBC3|nr:hypothetical protein [Taibaiella koreensis]